MLKVQQLSRQALWKERTMDEMMDSKLFACLHEVFIIMEREPMLFPMKEVEILNEVGFEATWLSTMSRFGQDTDMDYFKRQVYANTGQHEHAMAVFSLVYAVVKLVTFPPIELSRWAKGELRRLNQSSIWGRFIENFIRRIDRNGMVFNERFEPYCPAEFIEAKNKVEEEKSEACFCAEDEEPIEESVMTHQRSFTLDDIVAYAINKLSLDASLPIQNMLYTLLKKDGTDEDRDKVASIPDGIMAREGKVNVGQSIHQQNNIFDAEALKELVNNKDIQKLLGKQ